MRGVRAFLLGALAVSVVAWAGLTVIAIAAQSAGRDILVGLGPLVLLEVERGSTGAEATFGLALLGLAVVGGAVNALTAEILARRRRDGEPIA